MKLNYISPPEFQKIIRVPTLVDSDTRNLRRISLLMTLLWVVMILGIGKNIVYFSNYTWALYASIFYGLIVPLGIFMSDIEKNVIIHNLIPLSTIIFLLIFWRENL